MCEKHRVDTVWNLDVAKFMFLLGLETNYRRTSYFDFWEPLSPTIRTILITIRCVLLLSHTCPTLLQTSVGQCFDSELSAHQISDWVYLNISQQRPKFERPFSGSHLEKWGPNNHSILGPLAVEVTVQQIHFIAHIFPTDAVFCLGNF